MAVPKRRHSKARKRSKRANWKITAPNLKACSKCGESILNHRACPTCGTYKNKQVVEIKVKEKNSEAKD